MPSIHLRCAIHTLSNVTYAVLVLGQMRCRQSLGRNLGYMLTIKWTGKELSALRKFWCFKLRLCVIGDFKSTGRTICQEKSIPIPTEAHLFNFETTQAVTRGYVPNLVVLMLWLGACQNSKISSIYTEKTPVYRERYDIHETLEYGGSVFKLKTFHMNW